MWLVHTYWWLEDNNLWKAIVAFFVTLTLGAAIGIFVRPFQALRRHRATQEKIADMLDTSTPGGLTDVVNAMQESRSDGSQG